MQNRNIVLIGFRGTGKTTFGKALAKELKLPFIDLDQEIEFVANNKIHKIIANYGWQHFRELEQKIVQDFTRNFSGILASGGGTIENSKNLQNLKKKGKFVFLNPDFVEVKKYLLSETSRPRLNPDVSLSQEIDDMWQQRKNIYSATADFEVKPDLTGKPKIEAQKIIDSLPSDIFPKKPKNKNIAIFASTKGTTFQGLLDAKKRGRIPNINITLFLTNKSKCQALQKAKTAKIKNIEICLSQKGEDLIEYDRDIINILRDFKPDNILLMGWMKILSSLFCDQFGEISLNAHPSLLPKFAGLMGNDVHEKVLEEEEKYTGVSIHKVITEVDAGDIVTQKKVKITKDDTVETLKIKVQKQEILAFCEVLEQEKI